MQMAWVRVCDAEDVHGNGVERRGGGAYMSCAFRYTSCTLTSWRTPVLGNARTRIILSNNKIIMNICT